MGRGRYNQLEGNEYRDQQTALAEHYQDNEAIEGPIVKILKKVLKQCKWPQFDMIIAQLRKDGWSEKRIDAVTAAATRGNIGL